jgi:PAS domain S-box-containing protein
MSHAAAPQRTLNQLLSAPREILIEIMGWVLAMSLVRAAAQLAYLLWQLATRQALSYPDVVQHIGVAALIAVAAICRHFAVTDKPRYTVLLYFAFNQSIAAIAALSAVQGLTLALGLPMLSMIIALPYVTRRTLLGMFACSVFVTSGAIAVNSVLPEQVMPAGTVLMGRITFAAIFVVQLITLLRLRDWFVDAVQSLRNWSDELGQIRDSLEDQVARRSAQLEQQVTVAQRAEATAADERDFAEAVLANMAQGMVIVDIDFVITYANAAVESMFHVGPGTLKGRNVMAFVPDGLHDTYRRLFNHELQEAILNLKRESGEEIHVQVKVVRDLAVLPSGSSVVVVTDLTKQLAADAQRRLLESVVEQSNAPLIIIDNGESNPDRVPVIRYANRACEVLTGYPASELSGKPSTMLLGHESDPAIIAQSAESFSRGVPHIYELQFYRRDGSAFWATVDVTPVRDATGNIAQWVGILQETTARKQAEQALRRQTEYLRALHNTTLTTVNRLRMADLFASVVAEATRLFSTSDAVIVEFDNETGFTRRPVSTGYWARLPVPRHSKGDDLVGIVWATGRAMKVDDYDSWPSRRSYVKPGELGSVACAPFTLRGETVGALVVSRDKNARPFSDEELEMLVQLSQLVSVGYENSSLYERVRQSEAELEQRVELRTRELRMALDANDQLREKAVQVAAQSERARLARDLHDSVSQAVFGIALGARTIQERIDLQAQPELAEPLTFILELAEAALVEMRALIFELRPEALSQEGLVGGLAKQCSALQARHKLAVSTHFDGEPVCSLEVKEAVYRIALEAMQNIVKHARATEVTVALHCDAEYLNLAVCDNGRGFDTSREYAAHYGLKSMRERTEALGGNIAWKSEIGKRTCVNARVPLSAGNRRSEGVPAHSATISADVVQPQ